MLTLAESIDVWLFFLINRSGQNAFFDVYMPFMSDLRNFYIPIVLLLLYLIIRKSIKTRTVAVAIILLIGMSEWVSSDLLKPAFNRPRPYHSLSHVHYYDRMAKTWNVTPELKETIRGRSLSLPSSHATNIFAAAFFMTFFFRRLWPVCYIIAVSVGYSRVYLGVHFPFDVLLGAIVGTLCGTLLAWLAHRVILYLEKRQLSG